MVYLFICLFSENGCSLCRFVVWNHFGQKWIWNVENEQLLFSFQHGNVTENPFISFFSLCFFSADRNEAPMPITGLQINRTTDQANCIGLWSCLPTVWKMVPFCWCDLWPAALGLIHVHALTDRVKLLRAFAPRLWGRHRLSVMLCVLMRPVSAPTHLNDALCVKTRRLPLGSHTHSTGTESPENSLKDEQNSEMSLSSPQSVFVGVYSTGRCKIWIWTMHAWVTKST